MLEDNPVSCSLTPVVSVAQEVPLEYLASVQAVTMPSASSCSLNPYPKRLVVSLVQLCFGR